MSRGAEFSDFEARSSRGVLDNSFRELLVTGLGLDHGVIQQVTPNNAFRLGQQVFFYLGVANTIQGSGGNENWITRLRLKLWWARPNTEYRQVGGGSGALGATGFLPTDGALTQSTVLANNRYAWIPSPKRYDTTPYDPGPTPPPALAGSSDSVMLDDVWTMDLQDPNGAEYIADFPAPQVPSRWMSILYPAMGYALGFTWEAETANDVPPAIQPTPLISLTYSVGTLGGTNYQESLG